MLRLEDANLFVGGDLLIADANITISRGDRVGIVGRNGSGKSHLMQLLEGTVDLDGGKRTVADKIKVVLVKQEMPEDDKSPIDYLRDNDPDLIALNAAIDSVNDDQLGDAYTRISEIESERYEDLAPKVLIGLGLKKEELTQPMRNLSGGLRMRVSFAKPLILRPDILLMDEPTNHLDLEAAQWLIEYLKEYPKELAFVVVTHDIKLINEVTTSTMHLRGGFLTQFGGNYEQYMADLKTREGKDEQKNKELDRKIARKKEIYFKFRSLPAKRAAQAKDQLRKAELLEDEKIDIIVDEPVTQFDFGDPSAVITPAVKLENVSVGYDNKAVLSKLNLSIPYGTKIGLLGRNGEGKSTIIKLVAGKLKPLEGHADFQLRLKKGYFSQNLTDELDPALTVYEQFSKTTGINKEPEVRSALSHFGFARDKVTTHVEHLSGGEKSRLLLAIICANSPNFLILDEPTNHLDVETREVLVAAIRKFPGSVLMVSHDWDLHEKTMQQYWLAHNGTVTVYAKGLKNYHQELQQYIQPNLVNGRKQAAAKNGDKAKISNMSFIEEKRKEKAAQSSSSSKNSNQADQQKRQGMKGKI